MLIELDEDVAMRRVAERLKTTYSDSRTPGEVEAAVTRAYESSTPFPFGPTSLCLWNARPGIS